ncbi:hypothetical protein KM918_27360 [Priestia megaterium]|uniref:hypothetical protein n=1 Tax=Priestia megaterium TaxID=1404 RepID=UPI001C22CCD5|nr:hypothetical protein [Priestia megaterium]MBU8691004.1 hypothetical protein [Priestia megaterium]
MSNTIVHHHFGHLMGSDIAYRNLQAMQKVEVGTQVAITYYYKSFINLTSVYGYKFKGYKMNNN